MTGNGDNTFRGVHDYMDALFKGRQPSKAEIIDAKKAYWRAYNTALKRRRRKLFPVLQVTFSREQLALIRSKLEKGQSVSGMIRAVVLEHLEGDYALPEKVNTALIEQQLFLISEYLKELLEIDQIDTNRIQQLESHIKSLEQRILESL